MLDIIWKAADKYMYIYSENDKTVRLLLVTTFSNREIG